MQPTACNPDKTWPVCTGTKQPLQAGGSREILKGLLCSCTQQRQTGSGINEQVHWWREAAQSLTATRNSIAERRLGRSCRQSCSLPWQRCGQTHSTRGCKLNGYSLTNKEQLSPCLPAAYNWAHTPADDVEGRRGNRSRPAVPGSPQDQARSDLGLPKEGCLAQLSCEGNVQPQG